MVSHSDHVGKWNISSICRATVGGNNVGSPDRPVSQCFDIPQLPALLSDNDEDDMCMYAVLRKGQNIILMISQYS